MMILYTMFLLFCYSGLPGRVCHKPDQKTYMSSGRYVSLIFMSDRNMMAGKGMKLLVTAFSDGKFCHSLNKNSELEHLISHTTMTPPYKRHPYY